MAKAAEKRDALLRATVGKAAATCARAAAVAAAQQAKATGSDESAKSQLYERLIKAEVARLTGLKAKYAPKGSKARLIVVPLDDAKPRAPPPALALRLATRSTVL